MKRSLRLRKIASLASVSMDLLKLSGIRGVILDLDNTVVSEDDCYLSPNAEEWIAEAKQRGFKFFMLSNSKKRFRVTYWSSRLDIPAISPAHKPLFGFRRALKYMHLPPSQVIVIGDSLHTDILGAWLSGCNWIQVATLPHPPRWWEKLAGRWIQTSYANIYELSTFDSHKYHE